MSAVIGAYCDGPHILREHLAAAGTVRYHGAYPSRQAALVRAAAIARAAGFDCESLPGVRFVATPIGA